MPRTPRIVLVGYPHHVTQRGNDRCNVFFSDGDRSTYLTLLKKQTDLHGLQVLGYCLLTNHVLLLVIPRTPDAMAKAIGRTHFRYTQHVNRKHGRSGHLWQNRFYSCPWEGEHFWVALAYIERNPVRAGIVPRVQDYPWSSARWHLKPETENDLLDEAVWSDLAPGVEWQTAISQEGCREQADEIRAHTRTGRPLMPDSLLDHLEGEIGRRLRPLPPGRPRKRPHFPRPEDG